MKMKIFDSLSPYILEDEVNEWLDKYEEDLIIIERKFQVSFWNNITKYAIVIWYKVE